MSIDKRLFGHDFEGGKKPQRAVRILLDCDRPFTPLMFEGKRSIQLSELGKRNPFWISKDRHLCGKCKRNDQVETGDRHCDVCGVEFHWI